LFAKTRYRQPDQACILERAPDRNDDGYLVRFDVPQRAVTPGQSCVFYVREHGEDICLGGGVIESASIETAVGA
jgi:tRNA-specific 2-thiouridylase